MQQVRSRAIVLGAVIAGLAVGAGLAQSYSSSPPLRGTQAPGEPSETQCVHCHFGYALNAGSGSLTLTAPSTYAPGQTYDLTVALSQTGQARAGYELTVLGPGNTFIGTLYASGSTTSEIPVDVQTGTSFATHTDDGTFPGLSSASWTVQWTAPNNSAGSVTVYVAGVCANKNFLSTGDYVYATSKTIAYSTAAEPSTWGAIKQLYRAR